MTYQAQRGFTIIEVMLFLAVSGALTVGVLIGSGNAIAQQRYRDSVNSLKGYIQQQYSEATNAMNVQALNPECKKQGSSLTFDSSAPSARGTSECLILGRYILIEPTTITSSDVIGQPNSTTEGTNDIESLSNYTLQISSDSSESTDVAWGAKIVQPFTTNGVTVSVLILHSPLSGSVVTFVRDGNRSPASMIDAGYMAQKDLCVDSGSGPVTSKRLAVRINAKATGQSSIEIPLESDNVCG